MNLESQDKLQWDFRQCLCHLAWEPVAACGEVVTRELNYVVCICSTVPENMHADSLVYN